MVTEKCFVLLVFVVISSLAEIQSESFWGRGVFPDDPDWLSPHRKHHVINSDEKTNEKNYEVCETPECKKIAEEFATSINKSVDPCDDFYEFTCGAWKGKDIIPADSATWSRFMIFDNTVKSRIKSVLETPPKRSDILPVRQAKKWYHSCMNMEALEQRGLGPIDSILMQNGGWPISMDQEEWDSAEHSWKNVESFYARLTGAYSFFEIRTGPADTDEEFGSLTILPPKLILSEQLPMSYRNYSGNDYDAYVRLVESAAILFMEHNHANIPKEILIKEAREIVEFEKEIYELKSMDWDFEDMYFEDLEELCDNITEANADPKAKIDLESMLQSLFNTVNIKIDPETKIHIWNIEYFGKLSELLAKTPERTIVNYIHWTFVGDMLMYTTEQVRNELLAFIWQQFGVKARRPRWLECVNDMKMTHAAAYVFVEKYYTDSTEQAAMEMIGNIRNGLREKIENSNWLDDESKIIAKDKLDNMRVFLGFPSWYRNRTAVINHYKGITIGADYFENVLSYTRYENKKSLKRYASIREPEPNWVIDPITVNAVYSPYDNLLNLPAVDFQAPLFTRHLPDAVNYGVAGVIVGHEMGHGFDNDGIQYGKNGNRTELSKQILKSYYQRAECFTEQFEGYYRDMRESEPVTVESEIPADIMAELTRGENIADTTGIQAVFQAFQKLDGRTRNLRLPGLEEYTPEQLFFLSFAAVWCKVETPQFELKRRETRDPHSPAELRVIGSVSNTKDFARVFNCPKGSPMNPTDKCNIWQKSESDSEAKKPFVKSAKYFWDTEWKD